MCTDLIVIVGPTAVGKTCLTVSLARLLGCDILNADSRQLYASLSIGTASPTAEQLQMARHHFVGSLQRLDDYYSAAQYESDALKVLSGMDGVAILSGGSMMYVDAVCRGIDDLPTISASLRAEIMQRYKEQGLKSLTDELRLLDPEYYSICDLRNHRRVIHALEICYQSGQTYTSLRQRSTAKRQFNIHKIGLERTRDDLFNRINLRVDDMMQSGLLEEAKALLPWRHCNSLNTVGYKEMFAYIDGTMSLDEAISRMKKNTRVYAKKQMTWFRRDSSIKWFHADDVEAVSNYVLQVLAR